MPRPAGEPLRLTLEQVAVEGEATAGQAPASVAAGTVVEAAGERLIVVTGHGLLRIEKLQPAGKRVQTAAEFLRGYPVKPGERLQ